MKSSKTLFILILILIFSSCSKDDPVSTSQSQSGIPSKPKNLTLEYEDSIVVLKWETPDTTVSYKISKKATLTSFRLIPFNN